MDVAFPQEAHPTDTITHNLTVTALRSITLYNFTVIVNVLVNQTWQRVYYDYYPKALQQNESFVLPPLQFTLPQKASGRLSVYVYALVSVFGDSLEYTFDTTIVRDLTYGTYDELMARYNLTLANYNQKLAEYNQTLAEYQNLSSSYDNLNSTYSLLLSDYGALLKQYENLTARHYNQTIDYDKLKTDYALLQTTYANLNTTYSQLSSETDDLQHKLDSYESDLTLTRNILYVCIAVAGILVIALVYLKKKKPSPYLVLRKETVALEPQTNHAAF